MVPFVLVQMLSPLPRVSVPVQFTPYNSLKVFDISKHTGPGGAEAVIVSACTLHGGLH